MHGRGLDAQNGWAITPYAWWVSRWGLWPLWALAGLTLLVALWVKVNHRGGTGRYP
ncbi:hypothetical protein D3C71_2067650 [compost metagenome]